MYKLHQMSGIPLTNGVGLTKYYFLYYKKNISQMVLHIVVHLPIYIKYELDYSTF